MITAVDPAAKLPPRWFPLRHHPQQHEAWTSQARFVALACGRRSGKTELAKRRLVRFLPIWKPWPDARYFFAAPTRDQAKRIAWNDLLALVPKHWIKGEPSYSELRITSIWGSSIEVVGLDRPQRIEGVGWDGGVIDESCDQRPGTFERSVRPALADRGGWCWRIGVPKRTGPSAAEYKHFFDACLCGDYPGGAAWSWPSSDILPPEEIDHARQTLDAKDFNEQFNARWETAGGLIFHAFERAYNVRPVKYHPERAIVVGSDFNIDPMCWTIGHRYDNRVEWFDELFLRDCNTLQALNVLYRRYQSHEGGFEFYGDAASRQRKTSAASSDYHQILDHEGFRALGRTIHYMRSNPPLVDRFASCNAMLCNAAGERRQFVDPACKHLIRDLETRAYKQGSREPNDTGDVGHMSDAMGYAVHKLFPYRSDLGGRRTVVVG